MTMLIHQFLHGSLRRKNKMLAKALVFSFIAVVLCEDHGYTLKTVVQHEPAKEYRQHYEHIPIRVHEEQEPAYEVQYTAPKGHEHGGHAYSSQSIIHHAAPVSQDESQESHNEHVAPVYQYVQEEEAPAHHEAPAKHYQSVQFAPAQVHHEVPSHGPVRAHIRPQYAQSQEGLSYQNEGQAYEGLSYHGVQHHTSEHHPAPVQHVAPVRHEVPIHHAVPVHHEEVHAHDSHDEPIDYYAYPKYQYEYKVEDPHTGDNKFQHEFRDGDVVKGVYSLQEADGSIRTVEYSSDKHTGFNAIVKHSAPGHHVQIESHHQN